MATAFLLSALIATAVLVLIARPFLSSKPPAESPGSSFSSSTSKPNPLPRPKCFSPTVRPQEPGTYSPLQQTVFPYDDPDNERFRARFLRGPGAAVEGLPAIGGIYTLDGATGVELDFLELDRFRNTERLPGAARGSPEEEAHCDRMRQLGALWWPNTDDHSLWRAAGVRDGPYIKVGWPAGGGVWVLSTIDGEAGDRGVAIIDNAYNMDERCKALEQLGAVFYENPKDCPDLYLP